MPLPPDLPVREPDDGTWNQPCQGDGASPHAESPRPNAQVDAPPAPRTLPSLGAVLAVTPTPSLIPDSKESADSDESTPKPGQEGSGDWDRSPPPIIKEGKLVFGKYLLEEKIGEGGMGEVWRVENTELERESALKLIKPEIAQNDKGWRRFQREARLMAKLSHANAVAVYDFKRAESMGYIEMELVRGRSVAQYLAEHDGQAMSLAWTAQVLDQLCSVLQDAHGYVDKKGQAKPIIHRDLKPSNLMFVDKKPPGQNLKVLDFGIAKIVEDDGSTELTGAGDLVGTPAYMSPEQIRGGITKDGKGPIDGRSDLYSVGVLLYQFLTGSLPFQGMNKMAMVAAHLNSTPRPMKEANPAVQVPPKVERVVMRCLEKDPEKRPQTARELAEQFREALRVAEVRSTLPIAAACLLTAALILLWFRSFRIEGFHIAKTAGRLATGVPENSGKSPAKTPQPAGLAAWESRGYVPLAPDSLKTMAVRTNFPVKTLSRDTGGVPAGLKRTDDQVVFYCFNSERGIYLPLGYRPADADDLDAFWPKVLVRQADGVRFIRISGGPYTRGDFHPGQPALDLQGNPSQPHEVEVAGFYMQETEVTNKEILEFRGANRDDSFDKWDEAFTYLTGDLKKPREEVLKYPAVCINRATAQRVAQNVAGRLPTEAEWEYAARSRGQNCLWAGKNRVAKTDVPKARLQSANADDFLPVTVKSFAGEDETDQKIFDLTGNVREWCLDVYKPYGDIINAKTADRTQSSQPLRDPCVGSEPPDDPKLTYVVRGGSFLVEPDAARTFQRNGVRGEEKLNDLGFRVVIQCPPELSEIGD
jgi:serine/threonine-protein kinase